MRGVRVVGLWIAVAAALGGCVGRSVTGEGRAEEELRWFFSELVDHALTPEKRASGTYTGSVDGSFDAYGDGSRLPVFTFSTGAADLVGRVNGNVCYARDHASTRAFAVAEAERLTGAEVDVSRASFHGTGARGPHRTIRFRGWLRMRGTVTQADGTVAQMRGAMKLVSRMQRT